MIIRDKWGFKGVKPHWNNNELIKTKQLFSCIDILNSVVTAIDPILSLSEIVISSLFNGDH